MTPRGAHSSWVGWRVASPSRFLFGAGRGLGGVAQVGRAVDLLSASTTVEGRGEGTGCAGVTRKAVATTLDIPLKSGTFSAEGNVDFCGTLGVAKDEPVVFRQIRFHLDLDTEAPQDKLGQLFKLTERILRRLPNRRRGTCGNVEMWKCGAALTPPSTAVQGDTKGRRNK